MVVHVLKISLFSCLYEGKSESIHEAFISFSVDPATECTHNTSMESHPPPPPPPPPRDIFDLDYAVVFCH